MRKALGFLVGMVGMVAVAACGSSAPYGSKITVDPNTYILSSSTSYAGQGIFVDTFFDVVVVDKNNEPLNDVDVQFTLEFTPNQLSLSEPFVFLLNSNGEVVNAPYDTQTDSRGTYRVGARIELGSDFECALRASIAYSSASTTIKASTK